MTSPTTPNAAVAQADEARLGRLSAYLRIDPDNLRLQRDYADCALRCGKPDLAEPVLQSICRRTQAEPGAEPDDFAALTSALRRLRRMEEANNALQAALARWPEHDWLRLEAALLLFAGRQFDEALERLPPVTADPALYPRITETRIQLLHHLGRLHEAVRIAEAVLADDPRATRTMACICPVLLDLGEYDRALAFARTVLAQDGPVYEILETLASAALEAGNATDALQYLDQARAVRDDDGRVWLLDGLAHMRAGAYSAAAEALDRAVALMPQHAGSHIARGWNFMVLERRAEAMTAFECAAQCSPGFAEAHGSRAALLALSGDLVGARENLRKARLLDPEAASVRYVQALLKDATPAQVSELAQQIIARMRPGAREH